MKKRDFVKGPVNHYHLKYCTPNSLVYSKLQCSKETTLETVPLNVYYTLKRKMSHSTSGFEPKLSTYFA